MTWRRVPACRQPDHRDLHLLFIGAMGKSRSSAACLAARFDGRSTPISALIHAATMVTAGIFMVARMSRCSSCRKPPCRSDSTLVRHELISDDIQAVITYSRCVYMPSVLLGLAICH